MTDFDYNRVYTGDEMFMVAFDIGTTQSSVSYCHLQPQGVPQVFVVQKWPNSKGSSKIDSIGWWDRHGRSRALGAEALSEDIQEQAQEEGWTLAKWFKLSVHPETRLPAPENERGGKKRFEVPPLPPRTTVQDIYTDFFSYLFNQTKAYFLERSADGSVIWEKLFPTIKFVVARPNSWDLEEESILEESILRARGLGLKDVNDVKERVVFIREAEASLHFVLHYHRGERWLTKGAVFTVCDAGGSTVDITQYVVKDDASNKLALDEVQGCDCIQYGGVFVSRKFSEILSKRLSKSKDFSDPETMISILEKFETDTKLKFADPNIPYTIKFGREKDTDKSVGIARGRIGFDGDHIKEAFECCVPEIIKSLERQTEFRGTKSKNILLVGGFGESPYLSRRLKEKFEPQGINVISADEPSKKAVAEGAGLWFVKQLVRGRAARAVYGISHDILAGDGVTDHEILQRRSTWTSRSDGLTWCPNYFWRGCMKDEVIKEDKVVSKSLIHRCKDRKQTNFTCDLYCFDGEGQPTAWIKDVNGDLLPGTRRIATLNADLKNCIGSLAPKTTPRGEPYFEFAFEACFAFYNTSLKAWMRWIGPDGKQMSGPINIVPRATT